MMIILLLHLCCGAKPWRVVTIKEQDGEDRSQESGDRRTGVRRTGCDVMPVSGCRSSAPHLSVCARAQPRPSCRRCKLQYITQITRRKLSSPCRLFKTARIDNKWEHKILHYPNAFCRLFREEKWQCIHFNSFNCGR